MGLTSLLTHPDATVALQLLIDPETEAKPAKKKVLGHVPRSWLVDHCVSIVLSSSPLRTAALQLLVNAAQFSIVAMILCGLRERSSAYYKANPDAPRLQAQPMLLRALFALMVDGTRPDVPRPDGTRPGDGRDDGQATRVELGTLAGSLVATLSSSSPHAALVLASTRLTDDKAEKDKRDKNAVTGDAVCQAMLASAGKGNRISPAILQRAEFFLRQVRFVSGSAIGSVKDGWDLMEGEGPSPH
jgi:hypothetical protein